MDGLFKKIALFLMFLALTGCKSDKKTDLDKINLVKEGRSLIMQNCNILIDSLKRHDFRFLNKKEKLEPFTVGILDSIVIDERYSKYNPDPLKFFTFKLKREDFSNFKSTYKFKLVNKEPYEHNVVFISFSNLKVINNNGEIMVTKIHGISSVIARFYFKKEKDKWIFVEKKILSMG